MKKVISNKVSRALAVILSVALVYGSMPVVPVVAAEVGQPTVQVGQPEIVSSGDGITMDTPIVYAEEEGESSENVIEGVSVTATVVKYDGEEHDAAAVTGILDTDTVSYQLGENAAQDTMPTIKEIGEYSLTVTVSREGYSDYATTVTPIVKSDVIEVTVIPYKGTYDGEEHEAAVVEDLLEGDSVTYQLDDGEVQTETPKIKEAGKYTLKVTVSRDGYDDYEKTVTSEIEEGIIELKVIGYNGNYDGEEHDAAIVEGILESDSVLYQLGEGEEQAEMPQIKEIGEYSLKIIVARTGYKTFEDTYTVSIANGILNEEMIVVTPYTDKYDGEKHQAAEITGLEEDDEVTYQLDDGEVLDTMPEITEVKEYSLTITVKRDNYEEYSVTVTPIIELNSIGDEEIKAILYQSDYDGEEHDAVTITEGIKENDTVTWQLNDGEILNSVPKISDVGTYTVTMYIERHGYEDYKREFTGIKITAVDIEGLSATPYEGIYDTEDHLAVDVIGTKDGDKVEYRVNGGDWTTEEPLIKDAGEYTVEVRVFRTNYNTTGLPSVKAVIKKADQELVFANYEIDETSNVVITDLSNINLEYDFKAVDKAQLAGSNITYSVALSEGETEITDVNEVATIDTDGKLTINGVGDVIVTAILAGNENYEECEIHHTVTISANPAIPGEFVAFSSYEGVNYILGENNGIVSELQAARTKKFDRGEITYSINKEDIGLSCNSETGKITVTNSDYSVLGNALLKAGGEIEVIVTAHKAKYKSWYSEDSTSYMITISFDETPEEPYTIEGEIGTIDETETGWYVAHPVVTPVKGYEIAGTTNANEFVTSFEENITFDNEGTDKRYVYLKNKDTGGITNQIELDLQVDTEPPTDVSIAFEELNFVQNWAAEQFSFYNPTVTITFSAKDATSDLSHFDWFYTRAEGASASILENAKGRLEQLSKNDEGAMVATLQLPFNEAQQLRGRIACDAYDKAGNRTHAENGTTVVVDTVNPKLTASHKLVKEGGVSKPEDGRHYYSDAVKFTFTMTEANFYAEDIKIQLAKNNGEAQDVAVSWTNVGTEENPDVYEGSFVIEGDGDYVVSMEYGASGKDKAGNPLIFVDEAKNETEVQKYESDVIVIDTTKPVIGFSFDTASQKTIFTVTERNFRSDAIKVVVDAKDISGATIQPKALEALLQAATWKQDASNPEVYTFETSDYVSGIYNLTLNYTDIVGWEAAEYVTESFTIDHDAPTGVKIEYSTPIVETILETLTLGFYQSAVDVVFTAYDSDAGVESFTWGYTQQSGSSAVNRPTDSEEQFNSQVLSAEQDTAEKSKFTAKLTLTTTEAAQLRGYLAVRATDKYGNVSDKVTDSGKVLVVDNVSPKMTVEYSQADRTVGTDIYYKKNMDITFTVEEANFFAEDVKVTVTKDNQAPYAIAPNWNDVSADTHVGTYTLTGDGHYVINVEYTDRSDNSMAKYTSDMLTIDTIAPIINVAYQNSSAVNTMTDNEGNSRKYFAGTQTAVITITEHNFNPEDVVFTVSAKDVGGQSLGAEGLYRKAEWTTDATGDIHTMTITFPGDANYSFDVAYTDLAENAAADYAMDYFTVDNVAPEGLAVSYSTSILEQVLEAISFGFYNAKVTVTLTAEDVMSGVNSFVYSYARAEGVSSVNGELTNQTIVATDISYSNGGRIATATFEIPRDALGNNSQFNGTVEFAAIDRVGRETTLKDGKRLVVDNIAPMAEVSYNEPVNVTDGISYYAGAIDATVVITEANFYEQDVEVLVTKDGGEAYAVTPSWSDNNVDVHIGSFSLTEDGDYTVTITYTDKSSNVMETYTSEQMTIDTVLENPVITINGREGNGIAFKDEVIPAVSFSDENFSDYEITLTRTNYGSKNVDVTEKFVSGLVAVDEQGGSGEFDTFEKTAENDGIYTMTVTVTDKAGHVSDAEPVVFTVNRFGSVYEYSDYLVSLIENGGAYEQEITEDLIITEYNADRLVAESLGIEVTCDGKPLDTVEYSVSPTINNQVAVGDSGWFQYEYTIAKENFAADGVYKVSVSSKDATGNSPENSNYEDKNILFRVDSTAPEITSIVGLEESIVNATEVTVKYTVFDAIGLKSVTVYVDGKQAGDAITDFSADPNNYSGSFTLSENTAAQSVRIVVEDMAENATDTSAENFTCAYVFNPSVTVSTNFLVRWYANKALFWGTIGGAVAVVGAIGGVIAIRRRKKSKKEKYVHING